MKLRDRHFGEFFDLLREQLGENPLPLALFLGLSANVIIAPALYAATGGEMTRQNVYAIGVLGLVILALSIYLFFVIFQPERF